MDLKEALRMIPRESVTEETRKTVTVTGIVTVPSSRTDGSLLSFLQNGDHGIGLFQYNYSGPPLFVGDSIAATGRLGIYYGQEELAAPHIRIIKRGIKVRPLPATAGQVRAGTFHSMLVISRGRIVSKKFLADGASISFVGPGGDTASAYVDFRMDPQFDASLYPDGIEATFTGVSTRFTHDKPFTGGNDMLIRNAADIVPVHESLLIRYSRSLELILFIIIIVVASLSLFAILLRYRVRQKTRQLEEQARVLRLFFDSIAEVTGVLSTEEVLRLALKRGNSLVGTKCIIFGELAPSGGTARLTAFEMAGDRPSVETKEFGKETLSDLFKGLAGSDAMWNTSVDRLVAGTSPESDSLSKFLKLHLKGKALTAASPGNDFLVAFDHAGPISRLIPREIIKSYVMHVYSAYRAAELFNIARQQGGALEKLYNNSVFGLLTFSKDGSILTANRIAMQLLDSEAVNGRKISEFLTDEGARRFHDLLDSMASASKEKFVRFAAELEKTRGRTEVEFAVQFDPGPGIFYATVQDTSDRESYENYATMENKMATLERLASSLTHDLNNIVGSITGYASLLKRKLPRDSKEHHYADIIENSSRRTTELVKEVLGFSQLDAGTLEVVDLNRFTSDLCAEFRKTRGDRYSLLLSSYPEPLDVRISTSQIRQVFLSVLTNAAESMERGGTIRCTVGLGKVPDPAPSRIGPGVHCYVEIEDHGVGMDDAIKHRIFEPFFTTKRLKKYTGLSLSMAYNILKHHRGFISVDSKAGNGTKVRIYLPRYFESGQPVVEPKAQKDTDTKGTKILVVDDEEGVRQLASDILSDHGYDVLTANDGLEALNRLNENPDVKLVVLDMVMPGMGGKDACIEIKRKPNPPKVLICTGYSELSDLESILGKHADGLIQKPYSTIDMAGAVRKLLNT